LGLARKILELKRAMQMPKLRKLTAVVAVTATIAAGFPSSPVFAQARVIPTRAAPTDIEQIAPIAPVDQVALISSTIHRFPNGGEPLKLAVSDLIVNHRDLAASLVTVLRTDPSLTPAQKQAIVAGVADALNRLGIVAADMPVKAIPAAKPVVGGFPWWLVFLALAGGGAACAAACGEHHENNFFPSAN
jgi:hypothetical protein